MTSVHSLSLAVSRRSYHHLKHPDDELLHQVSEFYPDMHAPYLPQHGYDAQHLIGDEGDEGWGKRDDEGDG